MDLKRIIEAVIFASQKPLMPHEIVQLLKAAASEAAEDDTETKAFAKVKEEQIGTLLEELKQDYANTGNAFQLIEHASGWHVVTGPDYGRWVRQLYPESRPARLSGPALETLAIVAYRQPITKADIEAVRGVAVDGMMQTLLEKGLVRIAGRADVPGRPLLYETTEYFLEHFGLKGVDELPNSEELRRVNLPTAPIAAEAAPAQPEAAPELPLAEGEATADTGQAFEPEAESANVENSEEETESESSEEEGEVETEDESEEVESEPESEHK